MTMRCPNCQGDVVLGAAFCNHCGVRIQKLCNTCYTSNPAESRFCRSCGGSLSAEPKSPAPASPVLSVTAPREQDMPQDAITTCPRCSKVNEPGSAYCFSCGLPLGKDPTSYAKEGESSVTLSFTKTAGGTRIGFWIRFTAFLIDSVLIRIAALILCLMAGMSPESQEFEDSFLGMSAFLEIIYFTVAIAGWSTTIGKHLMGLCVLRPDGSKVGPGRALARYFAYIPSGVLLGVGFIMIGLRQDKRGLHDMMCDTVVVKR